MFAQNITLWQMHMTQPPPPLPPPPLQAHACALVCVHMCAHACTHALFTASLKHMSKLYIQYWVSLTHTHTLYSLPPWNTCANFTYNIGYHFGVPKIPALQQITITCTYNLHTCVFINTLSLTNTWTGTQAHSHTCNHTSTCTHIT